MRLPLLLLEEEADDEEDEEREAYKKEGEGGTKYDGGWVVSGCVGGVWVLCVPILI